MTKVLGEFVEFSNGRIVFVGTSDDDDLVYLGFRNSEGLVHRFKLSAEAAQALSVLLKSASQNSERRVPFPVDEVRWQVIDEG